ncbi:MAG: FtsQ-type POTRA domain-containing protein [Nitrospirota bacterium]
MNILRKKRSNKKKVSKKERVKQNLKKVLLSLSVIAICVFLLDLYRTVSELEIMRVREIEIRGNNHLSEEVLLNITDLKRNNILKINLEDMRVKFLKSPWIKEAVIRRELPGTIRVHLVERIPEAIIDYSDSFYLVDGEGVIIERVKDRGRYPLPVISGVDLGESRLGEKSHSKGLSEGLTLVRFLGQKGLGIDDIELVAKNPDELTVNLSGRQIKVGSGNYQEKFNRLNEIDRELKRRGVLASSIDLRFTGKVIVIPMAGGRL